MKLPIKAGEDLSRILPGPVLLLAGPGTGKTHQLARRVRWLVQEQNVPPEQLTVITFSDEAARNMRERLSDRDKKDVYLPSRDQPSRICTIHSLAYEVVRKHCDLLGFSEVPTLVPDYLVGILLEDAAQLVGLPRRAGKQAGVCRDKGLCQRSPERDECRICDRYCRILRSHNRVDYSDQMLLACKILRDPEHPDIKQSYQAGALHLEPILKSW